MLGAIAEIEPMTDSVLEISLRGPRPNFLQLLAQPEMTILQNGRGTGPYRLADAGPQGARLVIERGEDEIGPEVPDILLRGEPAPLAVARFSRRRTDLVIGGTIGDLAFVRVTDIPSSRLVFDPVSGLFGLAFASNGGPLADPEVRRALAMAVDRDSLAAALGVPRLAPRTSLAAPGLTELPAPGPAGLGRAAAADAPRARRRARSPSSASRRRSGSASRCPRGRATGWSSPISAATGGSSASRPSGCRRALPPTCA